MVLTAQTTLLLSNLVDGFLVQPKTLMPLATPPVDTARSIIDTIMCTQLLPTTGFLVVATSGDPTPSSFLVPSVLLVATVAVALGGFVYANLQYTPEILHGAEQIRKEERELEVLKLVAAMVVEEKGQKGTSSQTESLRMPLEAALGITLEEYVAAVQVPPNEERSDGPVFTPADKELAKLVATYFDICKV